MKEDGIRIDRRGLLAGLAAMVSSPPSDGTTVHGCADMLARALASEHGGSWRIHIDNAGLVVMMVRESSEQT